MPARTTNTRRPVTATSWYDFPHYYDLGFRDETEREVRFLPKAFERFAAVPVRSVFEAGCGSGRLLYALATRGFQVCGFDLNPRALAYCVSRFRKRRLDGRVLEADMSHFELGKQYDAGLCILNTFRHLLTEQDAVAHLQCASDHLVEGGLYIVSLHLLPTDADLMDVERWKYDSKHLSIRYCLRVTETDLRKRVERLRLTMTVRRSGETFRVVDTFALRTYRAKQMRSLLAQVPSLQLCEVYDFWYEIDEPQPFDHRLSDAVFVLRKVG